MRLPSDLRCAATSLSVAGGGWATDPPACGQSVRRDRRRRHWSMARTASKPSSAQAASSLSGRVFMPGASSSIRRRTTGARASGVVTGRQDRCSRCRPPGGRKPQLSATLVIVERIRGVPSEGVAMAITVSVSSIGFCCGSGRREHATEHPGVVLARRRRELFGQGDDRACRARTPETRWVTIRSPRSGSARCSAPAPASRACARRGSGRAPRRLRRPVQQEGAAHHVPGTGLARPRRGSCVRAGSRRRSPAAAARHVVDRAANA